MIQRSFPLTNSELTNILFGNYDKNAKAIELHFGVSLVSRDEKVTVTGEEDKVNMAIHVLEELDKMAQEKQLVDEQKLAYTIELIEDGLGNQIGNYDKDTILISAKGKPIKAKTMGQKHYIDAIKNHSIVFGVGPAGTGKTYLAVAMAVAAYKKGDVERIILTRPAVEAGEKLGFLPGDLQDKVDPYLRPLYDALFDFFGPEVYARLYDKGIIEVAPLAYMRGRTLDDSFIILDEAQNTTNEQMKMFLTRMGANSKSVITGDITQIDLPDTKKSGLVQSLKILKHIKEIKQIKFNEKDVVRHKLVREIIKAYETYYEKHK